ncbi:MULTISPECIES: YdcH family protein [unclassified Moraxella]|uniref:YdcH family protein n=1 Tax=unclassified Moraxella TaxID=2685852 RepID=UPI003AF8943B
MFPEYRDLISKLKTSDNHFAKLFDKHNDLDQQITNLENDPVASVSREAEIEELKKEKLALKDELFKILEENKDK